ncbi:MAG: outer membrane protein assembly factor BamE [Rhodospirillales bacterium]
MRDVVNKGDGSSPRWRYRTRRLGAFVVLLAGAVAACSPRIDARGYPFDPETLPQIVPGTHTRDDVAQILGSPSTTSVFDAEKWYYVGNHTKTMAFFEPRVTERHVVTITFDEQGVVRTVETFGLERGRSVSVVDRETPTTGNQVTLLDQLLGNLGRFNKAGMQSR